MAYREVTGVTEAGMMEMRAEHRSNNLYQKHDIPFETAFCLREIGTQPPDYDGPQRYCSKRAAKVDEAPPKCYEEWAYGTCCRFHGGDLEKAGEKAKHLLDDPETAAITHGAYADDEHLKMDFTDDEQELYDSIMQDWPEIYDWPDESEDPARYRILRRVAVNEVRAMREEDYLEETGEVYEEPVYDDQGVQIGTKDTENPLAREYRLLMAEVTDQMKELGLTPKERQKMDTLASEADKDDAISEIARNALHEGENDYDPSQFDE